MTHLQNLLFDLGGVIMDIKKDNCVEAFRLLGLKDPTAFFGDYGQKGPFLEIEQGLIDTDQFHAYVRSLLPEGVTDKEIDDAFMKFLIGIPVERLRKLQELRHDYNIYLLSNTNPIMWKAKIAEEFRKDGLDIDGYFDGIITSFEAKALKPNPEIFRFTIDRLKIKPEETLFFDDSLANLGAAAKFGFRTAHVKQDKGFAECLKDFNV